MNEELEQLVLVMEQAGASPEEIASEIKQYELKKAQDSQTGPSGESETQGQPEVLQSTTEVSVDDSSLEQENEEQIVVDDDSKEETIIEEQGQEEEVVVEEQKDPPKVVLDTGDGWDYKRDNGVYYTKKVGTTDWTAVTGDIANSIAKDIFPEYGEFVDKVDANYVEGDAADQPGMFDGIEDKFSNELKNNIKREYRGESNYSSSTVAGDFKSVAALPNLQANHSNTGRYSNEHAAVFRPDGGYFAISDTNPQQIDTTVDIVAEWYNTGDNSQIASNPIWSLFERKDSGNADPAFGASETILGTASGQAGEEYAYQFNDVEGMNEVLSASGYTVEPIYANFSGGKPTQWSNNRLNDEKGRSGTFVKGYRLLKDGEVVLGGSPEDFEGYVNNHRYEEDANNIGGTMNNGYGGVSSAEVQNYFWNLAEDFHEENGFGYDADGNPVVNFLQNSREYMVEREAEVLSGIETELRAFEDKYIVTRDDPSTFDIDETEYSGRAVTLALKDNNVLTFDVVRTILEDSNLPEEEITTIAGYFNEPIYYTTTTEKERKGRTFVETKETKASDWQEQRLNGVLESDMYKNLSPEGQEVVKNSLTAGSEMVNIMVGSAVDEKVARRRGVLLERDIANSPDANIVRGVIDEKTAPHNIQAKINAFSARQTTIENHLKQKSDTLATTINGALANVAKAGYGYHSEGNVEDGTFRLVVDMPEDGNEEDRKIFQKKIDNLYGQYETINSDYMNGLRGEMFDYLEFVNETEDDAATLATVSKEFDRRDVQWKDWMDAWKGMWWGTTSFFGSEEGLAGLQRIDDRAGVYRTMLTGEEAWDIGAKGEYASRTFTQQLPNLIVAVGTGGVTSTGLKALGASANVIKYGSSATTGFGIFGTGSAGQKKKQIYDMRTAGKQAEEDLKDLELALENGDVSTAEYLVQKGQLEKTKILGEIDDKELYLAMASALVIEGGVTTFFGTAINSQKLLKAFGGEVDDVIRAATSKWYQNVGRGVLATAKETGSEVIEESLIFFGDQFAGSQILGQDADYSGALDVVLSSIISAGPTQGSGNVYNAFTSTMATSDTRAVYNDVMTNLDMITASMERAATPAEKAALKVDYLQEVGRLSNLQGSLELDVLVGGSKTLKTTLEANKALLKIHQEAGVKGSDSQATIDKKLKAYRATLSGGDLKSFDQRLSSAQNRISQTHAEVAQAYEDGNVVEDVYGEEGLKVQERLSKKPGWDQLSNKEKAVAVHTEMQRKARNNRINSHRKDDELMDYVEQKVYGGKFSESGRKNRNRKAEDAIIDRYATEIQVRKGWTTTQAREGNISLESILADPSVAGNFEVIQADSNEDLMAKLKQEFDNGNITEDEYNALRDDMQDMFKSSTKEGVEFGAIVGGKYITMANTEQVQDALNNGEMLQGTVALHEGTHAMDVLSGMNAEGQMENFAVNLQQGLAADENLRWVDQSARDRVDALVRGGNFESGSQEYYDEYTKSVQDIIGNKYYKSEFNAAKKAAGRTSLRNWFNMATKQGFKINNSKDALNFMISNIEAFRNGEVSKLTKSRIDGKLDGETSKKRFSRSGQEASERVQTLYEEQGVGAAMDIIDEFGGRVNKLVNKYQDVPGFDRQLLTDEINTGRRGILDMILEYDQDANPGVPIAAYINKFLDRRAIEAANRILKTDFESDVTEARGIAAEETVDIDTQARTREGIRLGDRFGERGQNMHDSVVEGVKNGDIDTDGKSYKTLGNALVDETQTMFGVSPKPGNLSKGDVANAQNFILKNADTLLAMLPDGTDSSGKSTGINKVLLESLYTKGSRVSASKTGSKAGLAAQVKRGDITKQEFLEIFGITPAGTPNVSDRNTSARIKALIDQTGKAITNQAAKEALIQDGEQGAFAFEDGKSKVLYSKTLLDTSTKYPKIAQAILNRLHRPEGLDIIKSLSGNVKGAFNSLFTEDDIKAMAMDQFGKAGNREIKLVTERLNKIGTEIQALHDQYSRYLDIQDQTDFVMIDTPIEEVILGHVINDSTEHRQYYKTIIGAENELDMRNPEHRDLARNATGKLAAKFSSEFNERFLVPGLSAATNPKRGYFVDGVDDTRLLVGSKKGETGKYSKPPSGYMKGKLDNDGVNKIKNNKAVVKAQQENNQAFRQVVEELRNMVANGEITLGQATAILQVMNANQKGLTRASAILDFVPSKKFKGPATLEHMTPALQVNLQALRYIATGDVDQKTMFDQTMDNYRLAYLPEKYDKIVNLFYKSTVPYWQKPDMSPLGRYYGPQLLAAGFDLELDMMSTGVTVGGDAGIDIKNWRKANTGRKKALGNLAANTDIATDQKTINDAKKAVKFSRSGETKGMTAWDFDDTLATTKSNVIFTKDGETKIISAEDFAKQGADLVTKGWTPDFSEFNKVTGGKPGPMFDKAMRRAKKYGTQDTYILTARNPEAAPAIKQFLDALGLDIPLKNITGLGNSTGEAKARWLLDKHAQGYNNIAFADDAMQNIDAVNKVFNQFDIKGKVELAKTKFSRSAPAEFSSILSEGEKDLNDDFNTILEESKDVGKEKTFSAAKARQRGKRKGRFKFFLPPSAEDFKGLIYPFLGKGKVGEQHHQWFKENLFDPYSKGMKRVNAIKQEVSSDVRALKRNNKDAAKKLKKKVPGTDFTYEQAIRVYNWNKAGLDIPGLSNADLKALIKAVNDDAAIKLFADGLAQIQSKPGADLDVKEDWLAGTITSDMIELIDQSRDMLLQEFNDNADIVFSEENLNKIEAVFGSRHREAIEDILYRMKTGSTRNFGSNRILNDFMNWINGSVGTTMFFNARSAVLQMISNINFINWHDNNPLKAAKAFANQKQYWTDVAMIFNSPTLKQRRGGIGTDLNAAELLKDLEKSDNKMKVIVSHLLQLGFTPTQIADSLAIATGGATMYRNRIQTYLDEGMSQNEAESKAFEDMMDIAEETQQSTRPDKISQQQASPLGKLILAFQNTPMQYNRIMKRAAQDMVNGRGDPKEHISKIIYYGAVQSMIFYGLQTALFSVMFGDDEEEDDLDTKKERVVNGMVDSILRGAGIGGAVVSTLKNTILEHLEQKAKEDDDVYFTEYNEADVLIEALNLSPPIGIKSRKLVSGMRTWEYNQEVIDQMPMTDIDNPIYDASFSVTEAVTNIPLSRLHSKFENLREAMDSDNETWKRAAMFLGWNKWSFGIKNQDVVDAKGEIKEIKAAEAKERREQKKIEREVQKADEELQVIEDNKLDQDEEREQGAEEVKCAAVSRSGKRCSNTALPGKSFCTVHDEVPQQANEVQCSHIKDDGKRCKMKTKNKSGKCYYHD